MSSVCRPLDFLSSHDTIQQQTVSVLTSKLEATKPEEQFHDLHLIHQTIILHQVCDLAIIVSDTKSREQPACHGEQKK
jgi:hypothetical protein